MCQQTLLELVKNYVIRRDLVFLCYVYIPGMEVAICMQAPQTARISHHVLTENGSTYASSCDIGLL